MDSRARHGDGRDGDARDRILVVDDNPDNVEIIATRLRYRGYEVDSASDGHEALAKIRAAPPDLLLLDVMLPGVDGYEIAKTVKNDDTLPYIPIILVTARAETEDKVAGLDAGAEDYLTKPVNFPELEARVRSMLRIKRLQDELEEKNRELERLSISDGLTGLFNHRHIHGLLQEEYERAERTRAELTVAMFDLDRFKQVNDTYGHPTGDVILYETAEILRQTVREIDMVGRYGGEEFVAILPGADEADADRFAERVRQAVANHVFRDEANEVRMTLSGGVASFPGGGADHPDLLIKQADEALYAAKQGGRNRIVCASDLDSHT